jgi:hypothetical protein
MLKNNPNRSIRSFADVFNANFGMWKYCTEATHLADCPLSFLGRPAFASRPHKRRQRGQRNTLLHERVLLIVSPSTSTIGEATYME